MISEKIVIIHDDFDYNFIATFSKYLEIVKNNFSNEIYLYHVFIASWESKQVGEQKEEKIANKLYQSQLNDASIVIICINNNILSDKELAITLNNAIENNSILIGLLLEESFLGSEKWHNECAIYPVFNKPLLQLLEKEQKVILGEVVSQISNYYENSSKVEDLIIKDKPNVFISYDHEDGDFADLLKYKLEDAGFMVEIDLDYILGGDNWKISIDDAIGRCDLVIVVCSKYSNISEYVIYEWSFAIGARKKILPVVIEKCELHPKLKELQYIDFINRKIRPWKKLISDVKKKLVVSSVD